MTVNTNSNDNHEKNKAALSSVIAAVGLTLMKIVVGVLTGSLGILAEAAHSGLDLVAALVTLFAVKISGKAPDKQHHFGHGKVENLSALFETLLLLATSVWIIYEAIQRLFFKSVEMEISIWAFLVMIVSIVIDASRSRMLFKAAKKYKSQALEADALHFSTDIWSSSVVILGLILVKLSEFFPNLAFLANADAVAAMAVALIVVFVSVQMGIKTVKGLLDSAPDGMEDRIKEIVNAIPDVSNCHAVRVRESGPQLFADIHIELPARLTIKTADAKTDVIEAKVKEEYPDIDITIHVEPTSI
ncbi:MAG: cation transporter [Chloroflexi bacterium HGW-Chloroflexi-4]|jgi:cation diffusion facilitator family transporter|nr:MAG: cation transporter [Chloroflexi bacterium HGW-Chloroflexi-4]